MIIEALTADRFNQDLHFGILRCQASYIQMLSAHPFLSQSGFAGSEEDPFPGGQKNPETPSCNAISRTILRFHLTVALVPDGERNGLDIV
jgi:hypothetical protein